MRITFTRRAARTRMSCRRTDGTCTSADLGPNLPAHDFAHLIVERTLRLPSGFFVSIAKGYSIQELSDAATIRALGEDAYVAEILARGLGSLATGACHIGQFMELVGSELRAMGLGIPAGVSAESASRMLGELKSMLERFDGLAPAESIEVQFGDCGQSAMQPAEHPEHPQSCEHRRRGVAS